MVRLIICGSVRNIQGFRLSINIVTFREEEFNLLLFGEGMYELCTRTLFPKREVSAEGKVFKEAPLLFSSSCVWHTMGFP
jgi:hypothetical protein